MSKKMIRRTTYLDWDYSSLKYIKEELDNSIERYGEDSIISIEESYGDHELCLYYQSLETDEEYETRLRHENISKEYRRQQYEQLKKEFE